MTNDLAAMDAAIRKCLISDGYPGSAIITTTDQLIYRAGMIAGEIKGMRRAAEIALDVYGGRAHSYASENADTYSIQDHTLASCAKAIRIAADALEEKGND